MSWCRALLMVPHFLRWVVSSGVGSHVWIKAHPGVCESGVNDVGGRIALGTGSIGPQGFDSLTGQMPPMEGLVPGWVQMPNGGWQVPVICPGVYRGCCAFGVGQQSVCGRLCFAVDDEYV